MSFFSVENDEQSGGSPGAASLCGGENVENLAHTDPAGGDDAAGAERRRYLAETGGPPVALPFGVTLLGPVR